MFNCIIYVINLKLDFIIVLCIFVHYGIYVLLTVELRLLIWQEANRPTRLNKVLLLLLYYLKCDRAEVIIIDLQLQETQNIKFDIIKVLYYTKTHIYKSNYQLISFVIAQGYYEKYITKLDIIVCK